MVSFDAGSTLASQTCYSCAGAFPPYPPWLYALLPQDYIHRLHLWHSKLISPQIWLWFKPNMTTLYYYLPKLVMTLTRRTRGIIQFLFLIHGEETKSTVIWGYSSRAGFVSLNDFERWCHGRDSVDQWPGLLPIPKPDSWRPPPVWRALWLTGKAPLEATVIFILEHFSSLGKIVLPPFSNWRQ